MKYVKVLFLLFVVIAFGYFFAGQKILPRDLYDERYLCEEKQVDWNVNGLEYSVSLPANLAENVSRLCVRGRDLKVYVDNELRVNYTTKNTRWFGAQSPESYVMVPISKADEGKTLLVVYDKKPELLYGLFFGSEIGIWFHILKNCSLEVFVSAITFILGIITIIVSVIFEIRFKKQTDIGYLGGGVTLAAIWLFSNSVLRQIAFPNITISSDLPFLMVMLLPFPFIIYMDDIQEGRYRRIYQIVAGIIVIDDVTCCALHVLRIKDIDDSFLFVAICSVIAILTVFLTLVMDIKNNKMSKYHFVAVGLLGAFVTSTIQIVIYFNRRGIFRGTFLAVGLFILLICSIIDTVHNIFSIERDKRGALIANEAKGKFLANMSHEIRTPINAILGMDEMILRESNEAQIKEYAKDIRSAGKSLLSLINDILDLSKIDSGKIEIIQVEYDVSSMINDTLNIISHKAKTKNLELIVDVDENMPSRLLGDDVRIRQILINVLNNAVKYTDSGSITLCISADVSDFEANVHFKISDTGIGIKEEDLPKLYAQFERIEEKRNRNVEGTGLGMSITVQLLKLMGSEMNVSSVYGKGSTFYFDIRQEVVDETPIGDLSKRLKEQDEEYEYQSMFVAPDANILSVDDNSVNRKVLKNLLKETRVVTDEASSGEKCIEMIKKKKYDLIFLDHMMPGMDGIETLHKMHNMDDNLNYDTPVIALTANAVTGAKEMYLDNGFDDFLTKPINYEKLEKMLIKYLPQDKVSMGVYSNNGDIASNDAIIGALEKIPDLNLEYAFLHSKSPKSLAEIIIDFSEMIYSDADELEKYLSMIENSEGLKQYRVKVHSMKTSAAMIGAIHLSGMARMLELSAINEDLSAIYNVTPTFIKNWKEFKKYLDAFSDSVIKKVAGDDEDFVEVNYDILEGQLKLLTKAMEDMDVDKADEIIDILKGFDYSGELKDLMKQLSVAVKNLDEQRVKDLCNEIFAKHLV